MTEPNRWLKDGAPEDVARLLEAARREQPSSAGLQRTLVGLGVGASAAGVAGKSAALSAAGASTVSKAALMTAAKWGAVGLAATLSVATATSVVRRSETPAGGGLDEHNRAAASADVAKPSAQIPSGEPVAAPSPEQPPGAREKSQPAAGTRGGRASEPTAVEPIDAEQLAEQVKAIDRARAALAQGRPAETLAVLNDYESRFSARSFGPEALYLRMEALLATGRQEAAREVAGRLLSAAPRGPHSARARLVLEQPNP